MKRECDIILETILQYKKESTMKNIKVNALASLLVNVLNIVFPLITNPYLTRILSKSVYDYFNTANTQASFVIPLAAFGIYNYGIRAIIWAIELILAKQIIFINDHENRLTAFYFIGGGANILLNSLLYFNNIFAPEYYIATTIIAETVVVLLEIYFIKKHHLLDLKEIFTTLTRYTIISLGFIPIYFAFKFLFQINSYTVNFNMIIMVLSTVATCGIYYLLTLFLTKDKTLHYALNLALAKIKRN